MADANTIDEYLELKSRGVQSITISISNEELRDFVMEEMRIGHEGLLKKYGINTEKKQYFSTLKSKLSFGKYRDNDIKCVYKCDPDYIEWCMLNADSFCMNETTIKIMQSVSVWVADDLEFKDEPTAFVLDLLHCEKDKNGFPYSRKIREIGFAFSEIAIKENKLKLSENLHPYNVLRGGSWIKTDINRHPVKSTKKIKILF